MLKELDSSISLFFRAISALHTMLGSSCGSRLEKEAARNGADTFRRMMEVRFVGTSPRFVATIAGRAFRGLRSLANILRE
jgi:hypothetical protein